jgi:hypothetical protein
MSLYLVPANVYGIDFLAAFPDPQLLKDRGVKFVALYLKYWNSDYVTQCRQLGIAIIPIGEAGIANATLGAKQGVVDANRWVAIAKQKAIPADGTVPIILTHDQNGWDDNCVEYFRATEKVLRAAGYLNGGYMHGTGFRACVAAGIRFDLAWATNATGWSGGVWQDAHVWQGGHMNIGVTGRLSNGKNLDVQGMGSIDVNVSKRPFPAWGPIVVAATPPSVAIPDSGALTKAGKNKMFFVQNSDKPADPKTYLCDGFTLRWVRNEKEAGELIWFGMVANTLQNTVKKTTAELATYVLAPGTVL